MTMATKTPQYWLDPLVREGKDRARRLKQGVELEALLRGNDGTGAALTFMLPSGIRVWRHQRLVKTVNTIGQVYALAKRQGW
jgi:hypothetical protein